MLTSSVHISRFDTAYKDLYIRRSLLMNKRKNQKLSYWNNLCYQQLQKIFPVIHKASPYPNRNSIKNYRKNFWIKFRRKSKSKKKQRMLKNGISGSNSDVTLDFEKGTNNSYCNKEKMP
jgi:hypothetical protein